MRPERFTAEVLRVKELKCLILVISNNAKHFRSLIEEFAISATLIFINEVRDPTVKLLAHQMNR